MQSNLQKALSCKLEAFNYLYVLCDWETLIKKNYTLDKFIENCKNKDVKLVQYRDKISSLETQRENILYLKSKLNIPIMINDKIELIDISDGLHLGQEDFLKIHKEKEIAIKLIRAKIKDKLLGLSTHNEMEILEANNLNLDMIGLGAYKNRRVIITAFARHPILSYLAKISKHPVCAIGGVKCDDKIDNIKFNVVGSAFCEN